jgi:hypothetical protein
VTEQVEKASRQEAEYKSTLRSAFYGLWQNVMSTEQFTDILMSAVDRGMTNAFREGLKRAGLTQNEASMEEVRLYHEEIWNNVSRAGELAQFIRENSKDTGGSWATVANRLTLWANRYDALRSAIYSSAASDKKAQWVLGRTEKHCQSCYGFAGRVYRRSTWAGNNALPKSPALCCRGFLCDCSLVDTDYRMTPGPFPKGLLCG